MMCDQKMNRETARKILLREKECVQQAIQNSVDESGYVSPDGLIRADDYVNACSVAIDALTSLTQEQIEQVWGSKWVSEVVSQPDWKGKKQQFYQPWSCPRCHEVDFKKGLSNFCPNCGRAMTPDGLEIVQKRLVELNGEENK